MSTHVASAGLTAFLSQVSGVALWNPSRPVLAYVGELYLSANVKSRMIPAVDDHNILRSKTAAAFDQFVEFGASAHRLFEATWGRLGIAQLKVMSPDPGSRLIGAFVNPVIFIGLRLYWRDELDFKATGQKGKIDYRTLGQQAASEWDELLPGFPRVSMKEFRGE